MAMRSFRHWSPRYVWNRTALMLYERSHPTVPWLTRTMVEFLDTWLQPSDVGLEFGSGRSTKWFAQRVGHLTSVEHNRAWFEKVKQELDMSHLAVDYYLHEDGANQESESEYVNVVRKMPPATLDFCLVDGVARDHCAFECLDKLKPGGILIIDNVNWFIPRREPGFAPNSRGSTDGYASEVWEQVHSKISFWRCIWTSNGVTDTAFWQRP